MPFTDSQNLLNKKHLQFSCRILQICFSPLLNSFIAGIFSTYYMERMAGSLHGTLVSCMFTRRLIFTWVKASLIQACSELGIAALEAVFRSAVTAKGNEAHSSISESCKDWKLCMAASGRWQWLPRTPPRCCAVLLALDCSFHHAAPVPPQSWLPAPCWGCGGMGAVTKPH